MHSNNVDSFPFDRAGPEESVPTHSEVDTVWMDTCEPLRNTVVTECKFNYYLLIIKSMSCQASFKKRFSLFCPCVCAVTPDLSLIIWGIMGIWVFTCPKKWQPNQCVCLSRLQSWSVWCHMKSNRSRHVTHSHIKTTHTRTHIVYQMRFLWPRTTLTHTQTHTHTYSNTPRV